MHTVENNAASQQKYVSHHNHHHKCMFPHVLGAAQDANN